MIDLTRLRYALAVADRGGYAAAAASLGISQPALSRSVQSLEREYDVRLFDRGRGGTALTESGAEFLAVARNLLHRANSVDDQLRNLNAGGNAPVSFGMGPISASTVLPALLPRLVEDGTALRIRVESLATLQLLLRHGEIDFFVSGVPIREDLPHASDDLRIKRIPLAELNLLVRPGHPLLDGDVDAARLSRYRVASGAFLRELLSPARRARFGLQSPSVEGDDYSMLAALVRETDFILVATVMLSDARPDLGLVPLPLQLGVDDVEWGLVSSSQQKLDAAARRTAMLILDVLAKAVSPGGKRSDRPMI